MSNFNKKILIFIPILLGFLFLVTCQKKEDILQRRKLELTEEDKKKIQNEIDELHRNPIDFSNWNTYKNKKYGFEVNYPEGWVYGERYYKNKEMGSSFYFEEKGCSEKYDDFSDCENSAIVKVYEVINNNSVFWDIEEYEYGGKIPLLSFSQDAFAVDIMAYRSNSLGYTSDVYRFVRNNIGYKLVVWRENPNYNPKIERTILESFKFIEEKN